MLDINVIRADAENVKKRLNTRNGDYTAAIDEILEIDAKRRELTTAIEAKKAEQNAVSKKIPRILWPPKPPKHSHSRISLTQ